jgi:hypothetical protein
MDSVYASALLAIVAASGEDANAGFARIRPRDKCHSFQQQFVTSVKGLKLANTLPDLSRNVDLSVWNSRAWTYQDRVLSKRLLFVSEGQIYFRCVHGDTFVEDVVAECSSQGYSIPNSQIRGMEGTSNFEIHALAVENYSNRNLSFNDAINAMAGILSYLRLRSRSEFLFGFPASELDMAIPWQPSSSNIRRKSLDHRPLFPTWDWTS